MAGGGGRPARRNALFNPARPEQSVIGAAVIRNCTDEKIGKPVLLRLGKGRADALELGDKAQPTLADEIAALESSDKVDRELEAMKRELGNRTTPDE